MYNIINITYKCESRVESNDISHGYKQLNVNNI